MVVTKKCWVQRQVGTLLQSVKFKYYKIRINVIHSFEIFSSYNHEMNWVRFYLFNLVTFYVTHYHSGKIYNVTSDNDRSIRIKYHVYKQNQIISHIERLNSKFIISFSPINIEYLNWTFLSWQLTGWEPIINCPAISPAIDLPLYLKLFCQYYIKFTNPHSFLRLLS